MPSALCMAIMDDLVAQAISYEEYEMMKSKKTPILQAQDLLDKVLTKGKNIVETFKQSLNGHDPGLYKELFSKCLSGPCLLEV